MGRIAHLAPIAAGACLLSWRTPPYPLGLVLVPRTAIILAVAASLCVFGLLGALWARRTLADNWSGLVTLKEGHELVQRGPYRFVRHPIYTSLLLMVMGSATAAARLAAWLGFLLFAASFWIKIRQEEALMMRHFPEAYPAYKARVKALVPFVL